MLITPYEFARAHTYCGHGLEYNLRGIQSTCSDDERIDHITALGWLRDRRAIVPLLGILDEQEAGAVTDHVLMSLKDITSFLDLDSLQKFEICFNEFDEILYSPKHCVQAEKVTQSLVSS